MVVEHDCNTKVGIPPKKKTVNCALGINPCRNLPRHGPKPRGFSDVELPCLTWNLLLGGFWGSMSIGSNQEQELTSQPKTGPGSRLWRHEEAGGWCRRRKADTITSWNSPPSAATCSLGVKVKEPLKRQKGKQMSQGDVAWANGPKKKLARRYHERTGVPVWTWKTAPAKPQETGT